MATDKPSDASGIFSNITVKQSMSSYAGSPRGTGDRYINFGKI